MSDRDDVLKSDLELIEQTAQNTIDNNIDPSSNSTVSLAELMSAFSYALDLTQGQPEGYCVRTCWIGIHIGREIGLDNEALWELYYTLLLKDVGCSANASRVSEVYVTDDRVFKSEFKKQDSGIVGLLNFVIGQTGSNADLPTRFRALSHIFNNSKELTKELITTRCHHGAGIVRQLRFPENVALGINSLQEHWDGSGEPAGLKGDDIPLYSRIALLAQVIDVFFTKGGREEAHEVALNRSGRWFDPRLVSAFLRVSKQEGFWENLDAHDIREQILTLEPQSHKVDIDDDYIDDIVAAFGQVVDIKSPFTNNHSIRVAQYSDLMAQYFGFDDKRRKRLKRGALLHDVGKLGVSNMILDKPGKLTEEEWDEMRQHALHTETILSRISIFREIAYSASAHHERLDGTGYPHAKSGDEIPLETRIITVADYFDALTATRPYRAALSVEAALEVIEAEVGGALDAQCVAALQAIIGPLESFYERFDVAREDHQQQDRGHVEARKVRSQKG